MSIEAGERGGSGRGEGVEMCFDDGRDNVVCRDLDVVTWGGERGHLFDGSVWLGSFG